MWPRQIYRYKLKATKISWSNRCRQRGGEKRFPRLRCKFGGLPGSTAADIFRLLPVLFLSPYNRLSHWREKFTVWLWGGPCVSVCCLSPRLLLCCLLTLVEINQKVSLCVGQSFVASNKNPGTFLSGRISALCAHFALWLLKDFQCPNIHCGIFAKSRWVVLFRLL